MTQGMCFNGKSELLDGLVESWREADEAGKAAIVGRMVGSESWLEFIMFLQQEYASPVEQVRLAKTLARAELFSQKHPVRTGAVASYFYKVNGGGIEATVLSLFDAFSASRESFVIVDQEEQLPEELADKQDRLVALHQSESEGVAHCKLLADAALACGVDVLIHHAWFDPGLLWDVLACKLQGIAVVLYEYGVFSHFLDVTDGSFAPWNDGRTFAVVPAIAALCDAVVSENDVSRAFFSQFNPRAFTARHALADRYFAQPCPKESAQLGCATVLWVGRFDNFKHPDEAIRIFARAKADCPNIRLVLCGASYDGAQEPVLMQLAAELGVQDDVQITGFVDPLPYYQSATALISTTEIEGFCLVLAEACACGVPIVAYDLPYLPFAECDNVAWVPQGNVDDAARALVKLMKNQSMRAQMGEAGMRFVKERFSGNPAACWDAVFDSLENPSTYESRQSTMSAEMQGLMWDTLFFHFLRGQQRTQERAEYLERLAGDAKSQAHAAEQRTLVAEAAVEECVREYETSVSYRVGRAALAVPRAIRNRLRARKR